jgi:CHASE3 domain sensor protein
MQTSFRRFSVILGFFLLAILLVANGLVLRRQLEVQNANQYGIFHTQQLLVELSQTESTIKDAETSQRGFLYTEDPKYLLTASG